MSRTRSLAIRFGGLVAISAFTMFLASCAPQAQVATFKSLPAKDDAEAVAVYTETRPDRSYEEVGRIDVRSEMATPDAYGRLTREAQRRAAVMGADAILVKLRPIKETTRVEHRDKNHRWTEMRVIEKPRISAIAIAWKDCTP